MKRLSLSETPLHEINYRSAIAKGVSAVVQLPISVGVVDRLPSSLDALICLSDLQGVEVTSDLAARLIGEVAAEELAALADLSLLPSAERTGILLAGDFFSAPRADQRGEDGDVRAVWLAFQQRFRWVAGVAGNHDRFGSAEDVNAFTQTERLYYLDGIACEIDGLRLGGIGGTIGKPSKPMRRSQLGYRTFLSQLIPKADVLILHESPAVPGDGRLGSPILRAALEGFSGLAVCGHVHWEQPLFGLPSGGQVLNVDARIIVLTRAEP